MNGKGGGCCIARYGGSGGGEMYGMSKVDRIMLKYRPIAPKPAVAGSGSGSGGSSTDNSCGYVKCGRTKRKYVRVNKNRKKKETSSKRKLTPTPVSPKETEVVTLSLLPETPAPKHDSYVSDLVAPTTIKCNCSSKITTTKKPEPMWLNFNTEAQKPCLGHMKSVVVPVFSKPIQPTPPKVVSYVTVECVTDTWADIPGLGCTDEERVKNMEHDTCPSFISDGQDRVLWTNKAYRQMAGDNISVVLVRKDNWTPLPLTFPAFTCKVKVTSNRTTTTLPCDVWRMERGACAWRLDVKAALSLGR